MPVLHFTPADALQTKVIPAGTYPCEITRIEGPKKSSSGKSYSYYVDIAVTTGAYQGKTRTIVLNSESNSPSLLGDMQFYPQAYFLIIAAAIEGENNVQAIDTDLDTDDLVHAALDCTWGTATVEGRLINVIVDFHPSGYGASAPGF
jgi:hypothetical protein